MKTIPRIAAIAAAIIVFSGAIYAEYVTDFALVVGSFRSEKNAYKFVDNLKEKGYEFRIIRSRTSRGAMSRVIVGKFSTVKDALAFKEVNLNSGLYKGVWVINMMDTSQLALIVPGSYVPGSSPTKVLKPEIQNVPAQSSVSKSEVKPIKNSVNKSIAVNKSKASSKDLTKRQASSELRTKITEPKIKNTPAKTAPEEKSDKVIAGAKTPQVDSSKAIKIVKPEKATGEIKVREAAGAKNAKEAQEKSVAQTTIKAFPLKPQETKRSEMTSSPKVNAPGKAETVNPQEASTKVADAKSVEKVAENNAKSKEAEQSKETGKTIKIRKDQAKAPIPSQNGKALNPIRPDKQTKASITTPADLPVKPAKNKAIAKAPQKTPDAATQATQPAKKFDPKLYESFVAAYQKFIKAAAESDSRELAQFVHLKNGIFVYINPGGGRVTLRTDSYSNVLSIAGATIPNGEKAAKTAFGESYNGELKRDELPTPDCATLKYRRSGLFVSETSGTECNLLQNFRASKETINYKLPDAEIEQIQDAERTIRYAVRSTDCKTVSTLYFSFIAGKWYLTLVDFTSPCLK